MSGTEEVPGTRPTTQPDPKWKEYSLLKKSWYVFRDFLPILLWIGFGILCLKLSGVSYSG